MMIARMVLDWLWHRMMEPSSWLALGVFFGSAATQIPQDWPVHGWLIVAGTICAAFGFALREAGNKTPPPPAPQYPNDPKPPASTNNFKRCQ